MSGRQSTCSKERETRSHSTIPVKTFILKQCRTEAWIIENVWKCFSFYLWCCPRGESWKKHWVFSRMACTCQKITQEKVLLVIVWTRNCIIYCSALSVCSQSFDLIIQMSVHKKNLASKICWSFIKTFPFTNQFDLLWLFNYLFGYLGFSFTSFQHYLDWSISWFSLAIKHLIKSCDLNIFLPNTLHHRDIIFFFFWAWWTISFK